MLKYFNIIKNQIIIEIIFACLILTNILIIFKKIKICCN